MRRISGRLIAGTLLLALTGGAAAFAQSSNEQLRDEIEALKQGQQQIQKELQEIKRLLQSQQRPAPSGPDVKGKVFDLGSNPLKGEQTAKVTLVEFTDYQ